ncbi:MAG: 3'-5' exonuclease [Gemmatimonadetes bacterium]|nr:3'-5' exonuclease [Gemmatimonadota bacterium]MYE70691.1 3'-5' exonuclease [Gemmatimonadota bacterium]MYJ70065.1 3'-5' exonuclease [Gemmatimonadota bacterium]
MTASATTPDRSLLRRAWDMLEEGPALTTDLAREVLGLDGHPGAAAAAVFALLGRDRRFHVDGDGRWSLRGGAAARAPGTPLSRLSYAVVDVETTGGSYEAGHRITEVAVVEVRRGAVTDSFHTLVHPGRPVWSSTERLTGITDAMLAAAPTFDEVAEEVFRRLAGRVFVAHNAGFDWGWVRAQLGDALGDAPEVKRLCTISLTRRLAPELRYRNLDALADHFRIPIQERHRAHGDALATARILLRLLDRAASLGVGDLHALKRYRPRKRDRRQRDLFVDGGLPPSFRPRL